MNVQARLCPVCGAYPAAAAAAQPTTLSERIRTNVEAAPWVAEEVRRLEAKIKELAAAQPNPLCGLSWGGKRVEGDEESVASVKQAIHDAGTIPCWKQRVRDAEAVAAAQTADLLAEIEKLPRMTSSEIDGEESDGTPRHYRARPYVSLTKVRRILQEGSGLERSAQHCIFQPNHLL